MLINSHCHLDYFTDAERPAVMARAAAAGVSEMVTIGTTLAQSRRLPASAEARRTSGAQSACIRITRPRRRCQRPRT